MDADRGSMDIDQVWKEYEEKMPTITEMVRDAFYAGAASALHIVQDSAPVDDSPAAEMEGVAKMVNLSNQILKYIEEVTDRVQKRSRR